ncbi:hypothetical protein HDV00_010511 [Rhizophlyctis rosea]|nr:hypothetical protein HDV00_010511 [Rhizophlyctis rosea]
MTMIASHLMATAVVLLLDWEDVGSFVDEGGDLFVDVKDVLQTPVMEEQYVLVDGEEDGLHPVEYRSCGLLGDAIPDPVGVVVAHAVEGYGVLAVCAWSAVVAGNC